MPRRREFARVIGKFRRLARYSYDLPWCVPAWGVSELRASLAATLTGRVVQGTKVTQAAVALTSYLGLAHALPVNRGRTAIELALRALGGADDGEVVLPSYVCRSVLEAIEAAGARPAFADIGDELNVTVETVEAALSPRTRCVIVPHLFGQAAPIDKIENLLRGRGIPLIDDAAQALGARCGGRLVGTFGACGIVSCGPGKPLSGAAGGVLVTDDPALFERAAAIALVPERAGLIARRTLSYWTWRRLRRITLPLRIVLDRFFGLEREPPHQRGPMANLDAAILLEQLAALERNTDRRRRNATRLATVLGDRTGHVLPFWSSDHATVKLILVLREGGPAVAEVIEAFGRAGIECQGGYRPLHLEGDGPRLPRTEALWERVLCVPLDGQIGPRILQRVSTAELPTSSAASASARCRTGRDSSVLQAGDRGRVIGRPTDPRRIRRLGSD